MASQETHKQTETRSSNLHGNLLLQAKQNQKDHLQESSYLSQQLHRTLLTLIRGNSTNEDGLCPAVLDKITTIHQLDREIDRQLKEDVKVNYEDLMKTKHDLLNLIEKSYAKLESPGHGENRHTDNVVETFQRRSELIDQDLRILENTMKLVKQNANK